MCEIISCKEKVTNIDILFYMSELVSKAVVGYCERVGDTVLSEPVNLVSNLVFFISAFLVYKLYKSKNITGFGYWFLFALLLLIGTGSSLWHSFRNPYTLALDAIPIFVFFLLLLFLFIKKLISSSSKAIIVVLGIFLLQIAMSYLFPQVLNGSIRHVVNAIVFLGLSTFLFKENKVARKDIVLALSLYVLAIICRSVDNTICPYFPLGTHFLWHSLNAFAAYFAIKILLGVKSVK